MKRLNVNERNEILRANEFRKSVGMRELVIKVRTCLYCGSEFESRGSHNRRCGCGKNWLKVYPLAGREV